MKYLGIYVLVIFLFLTSSLCSVMFIPLSQIWNDKAIIIKSEKQQRMQALDEEEEGTAEKHKRLDMTSRWN